MIGNEMGNYENILTQEIKEAKDCGMKMWIMINKLKWVERKENEVPLYDEVYEIIEKNKISEEMLGYWETIYRKTDNKMKTEWDQNKREEYRDEFQQMGEADGSRTIEYNNRQVYERIPDDLMINFKLEEGRMWSGTGWQICGTVQQRKGKTNFQLQNERTYGYAQWDNRQVRGGVSNAKDQFAQ